jgi:parvulin-like peptidyl-prolyl isomerase
VSVSDVAFERQKAAERIWNPLAPFTTAPLDDASADKLLADVLAQKNISSAEFDIVLRRNAYLRKIVTSEQIFSEAEFEAEFERAYGIQTRVRHIQMATPGEVSRVQERLDSGEAFETLASNFSANQASALSGGLLEPFSRSEDQLPELFRQTAFALEPGMVSGAVRIGSWYHLIRVEERIPAQTRVLATVREELTQRLRRRLSEGAMFSLYEKVLREATIEIFDPVLREAYLARAKKRGG